MLDALRNKLLTILPAGSLRRRFARAAIWSAAGTAIAQVLGMATAVLVARILGDVGYGELGMIQSTVGMFGVFAGMGLGLTATKFVAEFRTTDPGRAGRIIGVTIVAALIGAGVFSAFILTAAPFLAVRTINAPHLVLELRISTGLLFFNTLHGVQTSTLAGFEAFRDVARVSLWRGLINLPLVAGGVLYAGLPGAVTGMACAAALGCGINALTLRRVARNAAVPIRYDGMRSELGTLLTFSLPAFLSGAVINPAIWAARALLVNQEGGYAAMGIFTAATQLQGLLATAERVLGAALLPMLASPGSLANERFGRANIMISWLIGLLPAIPLLCFPEIISLLFGPRFAGRNATMTFALVVCYTCIMMYKQGLGRVLVAQNMLWWGLLSNVMWSLTLLTATWMLRSEGAIGLATAMLVAYALTTLCFIPLYTHFRLVPSATIVSREAATIWGIIAGLASLTLFDFALWIRVFAAFGALLPLYFTIHQLVGGKSTPPRQT